MSASFSDIAAVVIVYFPDNKVLENIRSYAADFKAVMVIDNSPNASDSLKAFAGENYRHDGENEGIAKRLNQACEWATQLGCSWLLTMDQDSVFTPENMEAYKTAFHQLKHLNSTAMVGIGYSASPKPPQMPEVKNEAVLITSGSLVNLKLFDEVGPFNEAYFIDEVDSEYCLRARSKGFNVVLLDGVFLYHQLGEVNSFISLKSLTASPRSLHSPLRIYYMVRNYSHLKVHFKKQFAAHFKQQDASLANRIKNNLLYNPKRVSVLKMIWKGFADYKAGRMGKFV